MTFQQDRIFKRDGFLDFILESCTRYSVTLESRVLSAIVTKYLLYCLYLLKYLTELQKEKSKVIQESTFIQK